MLFRSPLLKVFPAALLGRIVVIPYYPLSDSMLGQIIRLQLGRIAKRFTLNHGADFVYAEEVVKLISSRCTQIESGGRMIDAILTNSVLPQISEIVLTRLIDGLGIARIEVGVEGSEFTYQAT